MLSATKEELKEMVQKIRLFEQMQGSGIKMPMGDEIKNRKNNRKSIVCTTNIKKGEKLTEDKIDIKRPGNGIEPKYRELVLGKRVSKDIEEDSVLTWTDLE